MVCCSAIEPIPLFKGGIFNMFLERFHANTIDPPFREFFVCVAVAFNALFCRAVTYPL